MNAQKEAEVDDKDGPVEATPTVSPNSGCGNGGAKAICAATKGCEEDGAKAKNGAKEGGGNADGAGKAVPVAKAAEEKKGGKKGNNDD